MTTIINGSSPSITFSDGSAQTSATRPFQNRIINGACVIDQRNAGAAFTPTNNTYCVDRWFYELSQASKFSGQQNQGSVTPPVGFRNYLGSTVTSAVTVGSTDYFLLTQIIEGFNVADLMWGTANAKAITLSFQVYSSLPGTFGGSLCNSAQDRVYPFSYTVSSANTWTTVSVTIAGDTSGTWLTTNGVGIKVRFGLGVGSTYSGTAGAWGSTLYFSATGATSVVGTNGATFYITGVQLEVGSTATSFDYRPYGTELQLCQRYFYRSLNASASTGYNPNILATRWTTNQAVLSIPCPVPLRTTPSISKSGTIYIYAGGTSITLGSVIAVPTNYSVFTCYPNVRVDATGILGSTAWVCEYDVNAYFEVSAEL